MLNKWNKCCSENILTAFTFFVSSWQAIISPYDTCFKRGKLKNIYVRTFVSHIQAEVLVEVKSWHGHEDHPPPSHLSFPITPFFVSLWNGLSRKFFITRSIGKYLFRLKEILPLYLFLIGVPSHCTTFPQHENLFLRFSFFSKNRASGSSLFLSLVEKIVCIFWVLRTI